VQNILKEKKDKDRLSLLTEASSDALYDWDIKNNRLWLSESYSSLFGKIVKGDNVRGWWSQRVHPEDLPRILSDLADSLNVLKKGLWSGEYRYRTLKGEYLYVKDRSVIVRDNNGEVTRIAGALTDITEQKLAEENLKKSAKRLAGLYSIDKAILGVQSPRQIAEAALQHLHELVPHNQALILTFDFENKLAKVISCSVDGEINLPQTQTIPLEEFDTATLQDNNYLLLDDFQADKKKHPEEGPLVMEGMSTVLKVPLVVQNDLIGVVTLASTLPLAFGSEDIQVAVRAAHQVAIALAQTDLIERNQRYAHELEQRVAERTAELQKAKDRVEAILDSSSDAIVLAHPQTGIQQTNTAFYQMFEYSPEISQQNSLLELVQPDSRPLLEKTIEQVIADGQAKKVELLAQRYSRISFEAEITINAKSPSKPENGIVCIIRVLPNARKSSGSCVIRPVCRKIPGMQ